MYRSTLPWTRPCPRGRTTPCYVISTLFRADSRGPRPRRRPRQTSRTSAGRSIAREARGMGGASQETAASRIRRGRRRRPSGRPRAAWETVGAAATQPPQPQPVGVSSAAALDAGLRPRRPLRSRGMTARCHQEPCPPTEPTYSPTGGERDSPGPAPAAATDQPGCRRQVDRV